MINKGDLFRDIYDNGPYGYVYCKVKFDSSGEIDCFEVLDVNPYLCDIFGLRAKDILKKPIEEIALETLDWKEKDVNVFLTEALTTKERRTIKKFSERLQHWFKIIAYSPREGIVLISILELAEEMNAVEKYYDLFLSISDIVIEFNEKYIITDFCMSHKMVKHTKMHQSIINRSVSEMFSKENAEQFIQAFEKSRVEDIIVEIEYEERGHPSRFVWFRAEIICKKRNNGKVAYYAAVYNIQKEKEAELEARQKTEELEKIFEIVPGLICVSDIEGNILKINGAWKRILGYYTEDVVNHKFQDFIYPDDLRDTYEALKDIHDKKYVMELVNRYRGKDGTYHYISWNCYSDGTSIYAIATDISKIKAYETELYKQKQFLKLLIDTIPDCIFYKDINGAFQWCNKSMTEVIGLKEEDIIGKTEEDLKNPMEKIHNGQDREVLEVLETKMYEETIYDRFGNFHYLETIKTPFRNENQMIEGVIGISRDMTNHKLAEEKIKESEERFRQMAESIEEVFLLYTDKKVLYISPGYEKVWDRSAAPIYEDISNFREYIYCEDKKRIIEALQKDLYINDGYFNEKYRIVKPDGTLRWIWEKSFPIRDEKGNIIRRAGIAQDITTIKIAEEVVAKTKEEMMQIELQKKSMELEQLSELDRLRTDFFANLSHELRTPINLIFSALKMIELFNEDDSGDNKYVQSLNKYLRIIKQNSYRLMRLINNLIDVTRLDAGFMTLNTTNWDIVEIVKSITLSVSEYAKSKMIDLRFHSDFDHLQLRCDADKIERIMLNLLSNAIKFNKEGGSIDVSISKDAQYLNICVSDTGIGIPNDKFDMIFERFKQVDCRLTKEGEGSGIGLSLVKDLVELHGGFVTISSIQGIGSQFVVCLPIITDNEDKERSQLESNELEDSRNERIRMEFSDIYGLKF